MTYEAVKDESWTIPTNFACADGTGIEKGAVLKMTTPRTAAAWAAAGDFIAGICAREKIASDGRLQVAVYRSGIFRMYASGAIVTGHAVVPCADNHVIDAGVTIISGAQVFGHALQDIADKSAGQIWVNVGGGN